MRYRTVSLATRISTALIGLLLLAVFSSAVAITSATRFEAFQETLISENLASVRAAEELEIALLEQRGYVSSYILAEGQGDWLERLRRKSSRSHPLLTSRHRPERAARMRLPYWRWATGAD